MFVQHDDMMYVTFMEGIAHRKMGIQWGCLLIQHEQIEGILWNFVIVLMAKLRSG